jgi:hypothetical protein
MPLVSRSALRLRLDELSLAQLSRLGALRDDERYSDLQAYCMFIGYPRSGHSMVGSLLDAHPEAVIAHEQDALKYLDRGYSRRRLFALLEANAERTARRGRKQTGYSYEIPGQYQGSFTTLRVLGDKKGGRSTARLDSKPELLDRLRETVEVPLRVVHVVRNPYDNIATIAKRDVEDGLIARDGALEASTKRYADLARAVEEFLTRLAPEEIWYARHEDFLADPRPVLTSLCAFVGLDASPDYLEACASIVYPSANRSRDSVEWTHERRAAVDRIIAAHSFFDGYSLED